MTSRKLTYFRSAGLPAAILAALAMTGCGSGSNSATSDTPAGPLTIAAAVGNYTTGCAAGDGLSTMDKMVTATFTDIGNNKGSAVVHYQTFGYEKTCNVASLATDVTATFNVLPIAQTKNITNISPKYPQVGTVNVAEATLVSLKLSKGSFTNIPMPGITTKVGYQLDQSNLRFVAGTKEADGLGRYISSLLLKKI